METKSGFQLLATLPEGATVKKFVHHGGDGCASFSAPSAYKSEAVLVEDFVTALSSSDSPWGALPFAPEFYYVSGRTDVIALSEEDGVIAFEAKLTRWRVALHQAFRNTAFANRSFVVLPEDTANKAREYVDDFARRNVGLCYVKDGGIHVLYPAIALEPINPGLTAMAADLVRRSYGEPVAAS